MLGAIAGYDQPDPASVDVPVADYTGAFEAQTSSLRLGIPRSPFFEDLHADVAAAVETAIDILRKATSGVFEVQLPQPADVLTILGEEAYAYHEKWILASPEKYQPLTRQFLLADADLKAVAYADALRQMKLQCREIQKVFSSVDLLVTPTMVRTAESFAESREPDPLRIRNTSPFDVFGLPTITVPCGFSKAGLPIGIQISGAPFAETRVLALAHSYERETAWHTRHPQMIG